MNRHRKIVAAFLLGTSLLVVIAGVQDTASQLQAEPGTYETFRNRVSESALTDDEKKQILEIVAQGESEARDTDAKRAIAAAHKAALATVASRVAVAKAELQSLQQFKPISPSSESLADLESLLTQIQGELSAAKQALVDAELAASKVPQRRREIDAEIPKLETRLAERRTQVAAANTNLTTSLAGEAARLELATSEQLLQSQLAALQNEAALIDAETAAGYYQSSRDLKARQVETLEQQLKVVEDIVEAQRAQDAAERVESATVQLATLHPALQPIGEQNRELATLTQELAAEIQEVEDILDKRNEKLEGLRSNFQQARTRVDSVGLTDAVGAMLRNLKQNLPRVGLYRLRAGERQPLINDAQFQLIELTEWRNVRLDVSIQVLLDNAEQAFSSVERAELEEEARGLLTQQRTEYLDPAIRSQTNYFNTLVSLSTTEQQIVQLVNEATQYVDERVLWIRSTQPLTSQLVPAREERWFVIPAVWTNVGPQIAIDLKNRPALWGVALLALLALVRYRWRLRREIQQIGKQVSQSTYTSFAPTIKSLMLTIATAAPLPLVFAFVASRLGSVAGNDRALLALAASAKTLAIGYFSIEFLLQFYRGDGLAESHFGWPAPSARFLRRSLRWLLITLVPLLTVVSFLGAGGFGFGRDSLERYFFIAAMTVLAIFLFRVLHPRRGVVGEYMRTHAGGWADRLSYLWYPLVVVTPIVLAALAVTGYYFTSQQLASRLFATSALFLIIGLIGAMVSRWALVHRRRLRIEQTRRQRESEAAAVAAEVPIDLQEPTAESLRSQMQQTRRLLHTVMLGVALIGVWAIWQDVLSARGFLEKWPVWTSSTTITESIVSETGEPIVHTRVVPEKITVADVGLATLVVILTFLATQNIPGLLEFAVLRRLPFDPSTRYAITSLSNYSIALVGLLVAGQTVGLHWDQIQWMATALTFGLAFGLQEMFANFIAGIIILFERPVRVGDVVEIDGVTGVVTKIRIRATTITDWSRKDYIVPNKEFITGKLLNWTRSDEITRLVINVGIAYGSDTQLARELLIKAAEQHPEVMDDPAPTAVFEGFGDNSLNFKIRVFINDYQKRYTVVHDLHTAIDQAFRAAKIEIAFPQRDLHLRSISEPVFRGFASGRSGTSEGSSHVTE